MTEEEEAKFRAHLEGVGVKAVRLLVSSGDWPNSLQQFAVKWLSEKERESERRNEVSQAEQIVITRSAKNAAWVAAIAAIVAAIAAVIAWVRPHM